MDSVVGIAPDVVKQAKGSDMQYSLDRELPKKKMKCRYWRRLAQLQYPSHNLVMEKTE